MNSSHAAPESLSALAADRIRFADRLKTWLNRAWHRCLWSLTASPEPQVWPLLDRLGQLQGWQLYDPNSGQTQTFGSELEIRLWLEQQYLR